MGSILDDRPVFFFDVDNCLYPRSKKVHDHMQKLIDVGPSNFTDIVCVSQS